MRGSCHIDDGCVHMSHNDLNFFFDPILNRHSVQISGKSVCCPRGAVTYTQLPDSIVPTNPEFLPNGHNPSIPKMSFSAAVFRFNRPRKGPPNALLGERRWVFVARRRTGRPSMRLAAKKQDELTAIHNTAQ